MFNDDSSADFESFRQKMNDNSGHLSEVLDLLTYRFYARTADSLLSRNGITFTSVDSIEIVSKIEENFSVLFTRFKEPKELDYATVSYCNDSNEILTHRFPGWEVKEVAYCVKAQLDQELDETLKQASVADLN